MSQPQKLSATGGKGTAATPKPKTCASCANLLRFDADKAKLHCGLSYFGATPLERVIRRRDAYPVVMADGTCERWR
jgi:hypothetical protein